VARQVLWDVRISHEIAAMEVEQVAPHEAAIAAASTADANGHANGAAVPSGHPATAAARTQTTPVALARVYALFERAVAAQPSGAAEARLRLLRRKVQVAKDYADSIAAIREFSEQLDEATAPKRRRVSMPAAEPPPALPATAAPYAPPFQAQADYAAYHQQAAAYSHYYAAQAQQYHQPYSYAAYPAQGYYS
jgi:hypothetical protein